MAASSHRPAAGAGWPNHPAPGKPEAQGRSRPGVRVAITGNMGAGKSTLARLLQDRGAAIVDADELAHDLLATDATLQRQLADTFGVDLLGADGCLRRAALAERAFADDAARQRLDALVRRPLERRIWKALDVAAATSPVVVFDAPLLFEWGIDTAFDVVVAVISSLDRALERLRQRGVDVEQARRRRQGQWPPRRQAEAADFVVDNDGDMRQMERAAQDLWRQLQQRLRQVAQRPE